MDAIENSASPQALPPIRAGQTELSAAETRVLGCLIEKQRTTPDQYPLTLNALRLACNQSTNRDPVVELDDAEIREALHKLERRGFVRLASGPGSRAPKYRHLLSEALPMGADEQAVMCVLMLRGAQTPGELKQRAERMHAFAGLAAVAQTLERLIARGLAQRIDRRPGQKEERFCELLTGGGDGAAGSPEPAYAPARAADASGFTQPTGYEAAEAQPDDTLSADARAGAPVAAGVSLEAFEELRARVEQLERRLVGLRDAAASGDSDERAPAEEREGWDIN
jgi:uncharacterized protein YceH (UPF0502 family)